MSIFICHNDFLRYISIYYTFIYCSFMCCTCIFHLSFCHSYFHTDEQPWPSGNALNSDQHGPGFEAQRRPLVTSGRASGPKCSCQN